MKKQLALLLISSLFAISSCGGNSSPATTSTISDSSSSTSAISESGEPAKSTSEGSTESREESVTSEEISPNAETGDFIRKIDPEAKDIVSKSVSFYNGQKTITYPYEYSDTIFHNTGRIFSRPLRKLSLAAVIVAHGEQDETGKTINQVKNISAFLNDIGFSNIDADNYAVSGIDNIGSLFAIKNITIDGVITPVVLAFTRGNYGNEEWAGNFTVGESGDHEGFIKAAGVFEERLLSYINANVGVEDLSKMKLWMPGYSRGAAIANVVGGEINAAIEGNGRLANSILARMSHENLYDYTFATPNAVLTDTVKSVEVQDNIYNYCLETDIVARVMPTKTDSTDGSGFDFDRYGVDRVIVTDDPVNLPKVKEQIEILGLTGMRKYVPSVTVPVKNIDTSTGTITDLSGKYVKTNRLITNLLKNLTTSADYNGVDLTRDNLYLYQSTFRDLISYAMSLTHADLEKLLNVAKEVFGGESSSEDTSIDIATIIGDLQNFTFDWEMTKEAIIEYVNENFDSLYEMIISVFEKAGLLTEKVREMIDNNIGPILLLIKNIFNSVLFDNTHSIITFIGNFGSTLASHMIESMMVWSLVIDE
ncbi:MAG: hypothetical protein K5694_05555 [Bacilli bacterium]|nr:hypothetical protein [Bacilli bacterium]